MAAEAVEFAHVSLELPGGHRLLDDVSLTVAAGTTTTLLGRSGSGKTTLLRTVNALMRPTSGRVLIGGRDVGQQEVVGLRRGIGYVIQETGLFPHMTIGRNVGMSLELVGRPKAEIAVKAAAMLELVGLPAEMLGRYPWQLSGGQRQRVGLARALAVEPQVLLLDEPFGALDPMTRAEMHKMLLELLKRVGTTTIVVTHDVQEALYLAQRVAFLEGGRILAEMASGDFGRRGDEWG